jgi:predicted DsbA family dithiol-disulfide isomerase
MSIRTVKLTIVSDVVCAWCYIGMARLHHGINGLADVRTDITWRPFELNPDMPEDGVDRVAYFDAKFGPSARVAVEARVLDAAVAAGIAFDWSKVKRMPNTRKAHVLIRYSAEHGSADAIHDALTRAHFAEGRDIGSTETLLDIAAENGMVREQARQALGDASQARRIALDEEQSVRAGVRGVPFFVMDERIAFSGAIDSTDWRELLSKSLAPAVADVC